MRYIVGCSGRIVDHEWHEGAGHDADIAISGTCIAAVDERADATDPGFLAVDDEGDVLVIIAAGLFVTPATPGTTLPLETGFLKSNTPTIIMNSGTQDDELEPVSIRFSHRTRHPGLGYRDPESQAMCPETLDPGSSPG